MTQDQELEVFRAAIQAIRSSNTSGHLYSLCVKYGLDEEAVMHSARSAFDVFKDSGGVH